MVFGSLKKIQINLFYLQFSNSLVRSMQASHFKDGKDKLALIHLKRE